MAALDTFLDYAAHMGHDCTELVLQSALLQGFCLAYVLAESNLTCERKGRELGLIRECIQAEGLVGLWSGVRADKRWELRALMRGRFGAPCRHILG